MLVYVLIDKGVELQTVQEVSKTLFENGITPITCLPEALSHKEAIERCDAILIVESEETDQHLYFVHDHLVTYTWPDIPKRSSTETRYPEQVSGFISKIMGMYRVHLRKNEDYSPANIMGTGEVGIVTRMWDKMARLANLIGFDIAIKSSEFRAPLEAQNESIEDNAMDMGVYSIIFQLYREGKWAK